MTTSAYHRKLVESALKSCRFRPARKGLRRGSLHVTFTGDSEWCTFSMRSKTPAAYREGGLGRPGLWQPVLPSGSKPSGSKARRWELHLPVAVISSAVDPQDGEEDGVLEAAIDWMRKSHAGDTQEAWAPPEAETVLAGVRPEALTVQSGPRLLQGSVVRSPGRLSLRFPVASYQPDALSAARRAWLREVLTSAGSLWRMARVGQEESAGGQLSVVTEVDLSGAPSALLGPLLSTGLAAARWVSSWLLWPVRSLTDPDLDGEVWTVLP